MIKVKQYQDAEFLIVDYQDGLREEDFCFICQTDDGKLFSAKPVGTREMKAEYISNIDDIIGKKGVVKYFEICTSAYIFRIILVLCFVEHFFSIFYIRRRFLFGKHEFLK